MSGFSVFFCLILIILLILTFWKDRLGKYLIICRILAIGFILFYYIYTAFSTNIGFFKKDQQSLQIINKIPEELDFFIVEVKRDQDKTDYQIKHSGKIRPQHFRVEYLKKNNGKELWFIAFDQKNKIAYFTQKLIINENKDQKIEARQYFIQSKKLSAAADLKVKQYRMDNIKSSIWITMCILLVFLNLILVFRSIKTKTL